MFKFLGKMLRLRNSISIFLGLFVISPIFGQIDVAEDYKPGEFALQVTFKKSMLSNSLPNIARKNHMQVLPYRHSNPYGVELGFRYNKPIEFSLAVGMGYHNQNQSSLICMDNCEFEDNFSSETKTLNFEGRARFYELNPNKKIWWVMSFENILYKWQDLGQLKKAEYQGDLTAPSVTWEGNMHLNIFHLGVAGESFFAAGPVKFGVEAVAKFPIYVYNRFELKSDQEDYGNKLLRQFAPIMGLGFKLLL